MQNFSNPITMKTIVAKNPSNTLSSYIHLLCIQKIKVCTQHQLLESGTWNEKVWLVLCLVMGSKIVGEPRWCLQEPYRQILGIWTCELRERQRDRLGSNRNMFMHEPIFGLLYGLQICTIVEEETCTTCAEDHHQEFEIYISSHLMVDTFLNEVAVKPRESNANVRQESPWLWGLRFHRKLVYDDPLLHVWSIGWVC